jgi:hypothetical protein
VSSDRPPGTPYANWLAAGSVARLFGRRLLYVTGVIAFTGAVIAVRVRCWNGEAV